VRAQRVRAISVNRAELQQLASDRIEDARVLLDNGRWTAAYYLVEYAVETGLKACILRFVEETGIISRYEQKTETEARNLYEAVIDQPDGVFRWIQQHW
jgi:hypothetical protein